MNTSFLRFPDGFFWGTATSSYQIEGGLTNDWSAWEQSPRRLADLERRGLGPATDFQSGQAANSWEHLEDDIAAIKRLNNTAYRFSVEWSRIEPEEGRFDGEALARYAHFVQRLKEEGIEPFVTLWHWPLPLWLHEKGGWEYAGIAERFALYAEKVVSALAGVRFWITLNEPEGFSGNSYLIGLWPPQKTNPFAYWRVLSHLVAAHKRAHEVIKRLVPDSQVSISTPRAYFVSWPDPISRLARFFARWWWNDRLLDRVADTIDFVGFNYYWRVKVKLFGYSKNEGERRSDMGWEIYPEGIYHELISLKKYNLPIYITENGLADATDALRPAFIRDMLANVHRAIGEGADVRGYFYWSLLDNFEWSHGFGPKFGLYGVDRTTWQRLPRPSADVYAQIAKHNGLEPL